MLREHQRFVGAEAVEALRAVAAPLAGKKLVHVNSTREGGGVAEILNSMVPLMCELGIEASWEVIEGEGPFFDATKAFHNGLQGKPVELDDSMLRAYQETNAKNAERLRPVLEPADVVFIHDPQPAPLLDLCPARKGAWIWRCHIDVGAPHPPVWNALREHVAGYDASIFHLPEYAKPLPHHQEIIPPSIDPLSVKNAELPGAEVRAVFGEFGLDAARPMILQVSRFDHFKDPLGVIEAYRLAREDHDLQLVLAGGGASDDPEGAEVLAEVRAAAAADRDIHVLLLPPDAHRQINALQRAADVVLQKSVREGFGLTVTEAMWKERPVIGGAVGGIRLQISDGENGFLVSSPAEAAERIVSLLRDPAMAREMARSARASVRERFLLTRHITDYLILVAKLHER